MQKITKRQLIALFLLVTVLLLGTWAYNSAAKNRAERPEQMVAQTDYTIVAFGDSLIEGLGAQPDKDFVALLEERTGVPILNLGKRGDTTYSALLRVDQVLSHRPEIVVVSLGGNDVLHGIPVERRLENLELLISRVRETQADILLLGVRTGIFSDAHQQSFIDFAEQQEVLYIPDVLEGILFNPGKLFDPVHPNNRGHELIADRVEPYLRLLLK